MPDEPSFWGAVLDLLFSILIIVAVVFVGLGGARLFQIIF